MTETYVRINLYLGRNGRLPGSLADLPKREGYVNWTTGAWGAPLKYSAGSDGTVTLASLGRDGKPGGDGDDADVIRRYKLVAGQLEEMH